VTGTAFRTAQAPPRPAHVRALLVRGLWPLSWILMGLATVWAAVTLVPARLVTTPDRMFWVLRTWSRLLLWLLGAELVVSGEENLPLDGPAVIVANHSSHLDGPALGVALPRPIFFVAKKELARIPVFGQALVAVGSIIVDRGSGEKARRQMRLALERIRSGLWVLVFAEGTRSADGRLARFKKGGFHLAVDAGVPVVPVAIRGAREILPRGAARPRRPGRIEIAVGEPIPVDGLARPDVPALAQRAHDAVATLLGED